MLALFVSYEVCLFDIVYILESSISQALEFALVYICTSDTKLCHA